MPEKTFSELRISDLPDIHTIPESDERKIWNGGYDSQGVYRSGAKPVGYWTATLDELNKELQRQLQIDDKNGIIGAKYAYVSEVSESTESDKIGFMLMRLAPKT